MAESRSRRRLRATALCAAVAALLLLASLPVAWAASPPARAGDTPDGFRLAEGTRAWAFPRDHGQHPRYRLEWWYYTGIVRTAGGRTFGYQVTFFRQGVPGVRPGRASAWAVHSLYSAHVALSDVADRRFLHAGRVERDSVGLAGAAADRQRVWLRDWRAEPLPGDPNGVRLSVDAGDFALELALRAEKPPVLHGTGGLDRKGPKPGQASWYYSLPRLRTTGTLRDGDATHAVTGETWMDHEFGTGQLAGELAGWDWLALRLEDGRDLMLYRLRRRDGTASDFSGGTLVATDGSPTPLRLTARRATGGADGKPPLLARMEPGRTWRSPATGGVYPLAWTVALPSENLTLLVTPAFDAQEQSPTAGTPFAYWEGVVTATGTRAGRTLRGEGYLELTGYAGELGGALR